MYFFHRNIKVRGIEDALAVFYHQYLWRLVEDLKAAGKFVGNIAIAQQIKVIWLDLRGQKIPTCLQAVLGHEAYAAICAVLENYAGNLVGKLGDSVNFSRSCKRIPGHLRRF